MQVMLRPRGMRTRARPISYPFNTCPNCFHALRVLYLALFRAPPREVNAYLTGFHQEWGLETVLREQGLVEDELVGPEMAVRFRYLIYIDGESHSDRLYWMMHTGSLPLLVASRFRISKPRNPRHSDGIEGGRKRV